jgi:hypothetical protein
MAAIIVSRIKDNLNLNFFLIPVAARLLGFSRPSTSFIFIKVLLLLIIPWTFIFSLFNSHLIFSSNPSSPPSLLLYSLSSDYKHLSLDGGRTKIRRPQLGWFSTDSAPLAIVRVSNWKNNKMVVEEDAEVPFNNDWGN